jgi:hypothetical protein
VLQREDAARDDGETDKGGRGDQSRRGLKPGTVVSLTCAQHGRALSVRSRGRSRSDRVGVDERNADQNDEDELDERSSSRLRVVTQSSVVSSPRTDSRALEAVQTTRGEAPRRTRTWGESPKAACKTSRQPGRLASTRLYRSGLLAIARMQPILKD